MLLRLSQDSPSKYFKRRKRIARSVSCSWHHQPPVEYRSTSTPPLHRFHRHRVRLTGGGKITVSKITCEEPTELFRDREIVFLRDLVGEESGERPRRRFVSNEARTLKSRRPARHAAVPHVFSLSFSLFLSLSFSSHSVCSLRLLLLPSSRLPFCPYSRSCGSLSHPRCSLEPYFKNSFVLSLSCSPFVSAPSSSAAPPAARKTSGFEGKDQG